MIDSYVTSGAGPKIVRMILCYKLPYMCKMSLFNHECAAIYSGARCLNRGSYMSAHVLLNLLNELGIY